MAGLDPAIHAYSDVRALTMDARLKPGHDENAVEYRPCTTSDGSATTPTRSTAALTRRGLDAASRRKPDRDSTSAAAPRSRSSKPRRRAATRPRRRSARPRRRRTRRARAGADGRGRRAEGRRCRRWKPRRRQLGDELDNGARRRFRTCRSTTCRTARTSTATSSIITSGRSANYAFTPKQHFELGEALGLMDFETAAKLSGARFVVLKSGLARLERALGQFMLDLHTQRARLHRGQSAAAGARRGDVRHGAVAEVSRTISFLQTRLERTSRCLTRACSSTISSTDRRA